MIVKQFYFQYYEAVLTSYYNNVDCWIILKIDKIDVKPFQCHHSFIQAKTWKQIVQVGVSYPTQNGKIYRIIQSDRQRYQVLVQCTSTCTTTGIMLTEWPDRYRTKYECTCKSIVVDKGHTYRIYKDMYLQECTISTS